MAKKLKGGKKLAKATTLKKINNATIGRGLR